MMDGASKNSFCSMWNGRRDRNVKSKVRVRATTSTSVTTVNITSFHRDMFELVSCEVVNGAIISYAASSPKKASVWRTVWLS